jgi:CrcB protein
MLPPPGPARPRPRFAELEWEVAAGGAIGAVARYLVSEQVPWAGPPTWPWAIFAVNIVGCLLMGLLIGAIARDRRYDRWRPFAGIGVLGGFTTMSTFAAEVRDLYAGGGPAVSLSYAVVSVVAGLAAVMLGARLVSGRA